MVDTEQLIILDTDIMSNIPMFAGTHVPVQTLIEYLEAGNTLDDFSTVDLEKAKLVLTY